MPDLQKRETPDSAPPGRERSATAARRGGHPDKPPSANAGNVGLGGMKRDSETKDRQDEI